jgi:hypothetical protein
MHMYIGYRKQLLGRTESQDAFVTAIEIHCIYIIYVRRREQIPQIPQITELRE